MRRRGQAVDGQAKTREENHGYVVVVPAPEVGGQAELAFAVIDAAHVPRPGEFLMRPDLLHRNPSDSGYEAYRVRAVVNLIPDLSLGSPVGTGTVVVVEVDPVPIHEASAAHGVRVAAYQAAEVPLPSYRGVVSLRAIEDVVNAFRASGGVDTPVSR